MKLALGPLLHRRGVTQTALADAIGVNKSFISEIVSGKKDPSFDTLKRIVEALDVDPSDIYERDRPVPVVGFVGAGAAVELVDAYAKGDGLYHVACPDDLPARDVVAVEVQGQSMEPLIQPGDVLFFTRHFMGVDPAALNRVAICETQDGRALVKLIRAGRDRGTFDLYSINAAVNGPEYGVRLKWAAPYRRHLQQADVERI